MTKISGQSGIDRALPLPVVYLFAFIVFIVGCGTIYYGFNDGILHQDLATWTKLGRIAHYKGITAIVAGGVITCIGLFLALLAVFIARNEREQRIIKGE